MENASRALVIAGGVLLSLIIIGVVMFAYRGITSLQKEKDISLSNEQVSKINEQIEKYTKKSVIYGSEVLSICRFPLLYLPCRTSPLSRITAENILKVKDTK